MSAVPPIAPTPAARRLATVALLLVLVVVGASSYLRLAGDGLGCEPWPDCYGTAAAAERAAASTTVAVLRATHRAAASAFLVAAIALAVLARKDRARRDAALAALAITLLLAAVGLLSPSPLPWVNWVNALGGFALVVLVLRLRDAHAFRTGLLGRIVVALLVVQSAAGVLLSVRAAGGECAPSCGVRPGGAFAALWHPLRAGTAKALAQDAGGATLLHAAHRVPGLALALGCALWGLAGRRVRTGIAAPSAAVLASGFVLAGGSGPAAGAVHAVAAALLVAGSALCAVNAAVARRQRVA